VENPNKQREREREKGKIGRRGFSLVELLVVVTIIAILSGVAYVGIQASQRKAKNERMLDDLTAEANVMEQYKRDHLGEYPPLPLGGNKNILCFDAHAEYTHDCAAAAFIQGFVDNDLLGKRYLQEVPTDPWTGSRYVYGRSKDGQYYQVAGLWQNSNGSFEARTQDNLYKGFPLPSIVRAFDGPNFVVQRGGFLPYSADARTLTATARNVNGAAFVTLRSGSDEESPLFTGQLLAQGMKVRTGAGRADLYFSDGSVTSLEANTRLELKNLTVAKNDQGGIITRITAKLIGSTGKIWNKVVRLSQNSEFNVETTSAIAGVRGTEFGVDLSGGSEALTVLSGRIQVNNTAGTLVDFVDSVPGNQLGDADVTAPVKVTLGGAAVSPILLTPDEIRTIQNDFYNTLTLTNEMAPRVLGVAGGTVTVQNIYRTMGLDPSPAGAVTIPGSRISLEYTNAAGETVPFPTTFGFPDLRNGGSDYPLALTGDWSGVRLRFEEFSSAAPAPGDLPLSASAWSTPALTIGTGTALSGADLGNGGTEAAASEPALRTLNFPTVAVPDFLTGISSGAGVWAETEGYDFAAPATYEITSDEGICAGTGTMTASPQSLSFTATLPDRVNRAECRLRVRLTLGGTTLERTGLVPVQRSNPPTGAVSSAVTGERPGFIDISSRSSGDTLTFTFRVNVVDHTAASVDVRTPDPGGASLLTSPVPLTGTGEITGTAAVDLTRATTLRRGATNTVLFRLTSTPPGGTAETLDYPFSFPLGRPTVTRIRFDLPSAEVAPGASVRLRVVAVDSNDTALTTASAPVDVTDLCDWTGATVTAADDLTALATATDGTVLTPICTIPDTARVTIGGRVFAFASGISTLSTTVTVRAPALSLCPAGVREDSGGCWIMTAGSCTTACSALTSPLRARAMRCNNPVAPDTGWNDVGCSQCLALNAGAAGLVCYSDVGGAPISDGSAPFFNVARGVSRCNYRASGTSLNCDSPPSLGRRVCKCE